jgi:catechol 2,3-dioxygenase-like lactoylglutathione lyase family enzyme
MEERIMKKKLTFGIIVQDYDKAINFYTRKLGFVVAEDVPIGEDRWVTITLPGNQDCTIALHKALNHYDLALIGKQGGSFPFLGIDTEDCIGEYQRMKALGVKFHGEPDIQPYGTGVMLEDLYGNKIFMNQEPADSVGHPD